MPIKVRRLIDSDVVSTAPRTQISISISSDSMTETLSDRTEVKKLNKSVRDVLPSISQAITSHRLATVEAFDGDLELGFAKPSTAALKAIRHFLTAAYEINPDLDSPIISPTSDGEVIISWRRPGIYLICCFDDSSVFEWLFKRSELICGFADSASPLIRRQLTEVVDILNNVASIFRIANFSSLSIERGFVDFVTEDVKDGVEVNWMAAPL